MKLPAIENATLTQVTNAAAGFRPDWDQAGTTGPAKWTGSERVYWSEEEEAVDRGEVEDRRTRATRDYYVHRYVIVNDGVGIDFNIDDTITVNRDVGGVTTAQVKNIVHTGGFGLDGVIRIVLTDV